MPSSLTFTREGASAVATPVLDGMPVIVGDELFVTDMLNVLSGQCADPWFPPNDEETPVFNLCAAAVVCGADYVSTDTDTDVPFPLY